MHARRAGLLLCSLCLLSLPAAGCGGGEPEAPGAPREATLVLDFLPGPVHAGIYRALAQGYYAEEGIDLRIAEPTATADTLRLVESGRAELGIGEGIDIANQIAAGRDIQAVLALTQRPLGGLVTLAREGFTTPAELEGRDVGVTGVPSDEAVVSTIVADAGGDPARVRRVTVGFGGVKALLAGRIDAFTAFIPTDAVQIELEGPATRSFAVDEFGGPRYPGLVVFSTREEIRADPKLMDGFVGATIRGYEDVLADPETGAAALLERNPQLSAEFVRRSLRAHLRLFAGGRPFGTLDPRALRELSAFLVGAGLIERPILPARYATQRFLPAR